MVPCPRTSTSSSSARGISGLVAARQVARTGRSVLVVEARDRVGGRVLNHRLGTGDTIESGGAFVGPTQDHIIALANELKVPMFEEYVDGKSVYNSSGLLGRQEYDGTVPPDPLILPDAAVLQYQLDQWASEIDVDAPWTHPRAKEWDSKTLGDYIRKNTVNPSGIGNLINCWTQPGFGADPDQLSLLFVIHYVACSGNETTKGTFERNSDTADGAQERRFIGGSQLIPLRLASQLGSRVALNAPVTRIDQNSTQAVVRTSRGAVTCKRVIVAVPPELSRAIQWGPDLPTAHRALLEPHEHGRPDEVRRRVRRAVLARRRSQRLRPQRPRCRACGLRQLAVRRQARRAARVRGRLDLEAVRPHHPRRPQGRRAEGLRRDVRREGAAPDRVRRARLDQGALDQGQPRSRSWRPAR